MDALGQGRWPALRLRRSEALGTRAIAELASQDNVRACLQFFSRERQWITEQQLQVSRIPAPTFFEQKRAEWVAAQLRDYGYDARLDRAGNVVAHAPQAQDGPFLAVTAHLDTVLAPRVPEEVTLRSDGRLAGPGISDNGAGLAALLALAKATLLTPPMPGAHSHLLFIANVGEEGEGNLSGMRYLCRQSPLAGKIRQFVVLDGPSTEHITCQALASKRYEVTVSGTGGHSWSDYGIGNPVHALSRAVTLFTDRAAALPASNPRLSYNVGVMEGGGSVNSIPTLARAKVDLRSESMMALDELALLLTQGVERAVEVENERATSSRVSARVTAKIREIGYRPGGQLPPDSPLLYAVQSVDAHLGLRSQVDCASTDANIPLSLGLPAVSIGAGGRGGGAHTPEEWFHPEGRDAGLQRILLTLAFLLQQEMAVASA